MQQFTPNEIKRAMAPRSAGGLGARSALEAQVVLDRIVDREDEAEVAYDDFTTAEYGAFIASIVRAAYASRVKVGEMERGAYYDTTRWSMKASGVTAKQVRDVLAHRDGQSMASYGSFGGYSTIGNVTPVGTDEFIVESVYHIGD